MTGVKISEYTLAASLNGTEKIPLGVGVKKATTPDQLRAYIAGESAIYAKKLIVIGDSLSNGYLAGGLLYSWPNVMCQQLDWELINNAALNYSGYIPTTTDPFIDRINSTIPLGYDGNVILHGAINDCLFANGVLGLLGTSNESTLYGAIDAAIRAVFARSDSLMLWVMMPYVSAHSEEATQNSDGWAFAQGRAAQRHVATRLQKTFGNRLRIIDAERDFTPLIGRDYSENTIDQLHPSPVGHSVMARYIASVMTDDALLAQRQDLYSVNFSTLLSGSLNGKDGWAVESGSYTVGSGGLTVDAVFSSNTNGALHNTPSGARSVRMLVTGKAVLSWRKQGGSGFSIWTYGVDGNAAIAGWNFGTVAGASVVIYPPSNRTLANGTYWLELEQDGGFLNARAWAEGATRPMQPLATHKITPAEAVAHPALGVIGITSTSPDAALVKQIIVLE